MPIMTRVATRTGKASCATRLTCTRQSSVLSTTVVGSTGVLYAGECRSSKCRFAHGEVDLRRNRKPKKKRLATRATPSTAPSPANETKQPLEAHPPEDSSTCPVTQNAIDLLLAHEGFYPSAPYCYYPTGEAQPSEG